MSQSLLSTLDAILGSTESSRAIAAIITLIRREFRGNVPGPDAERIGVGDLLVGSVGFALLQSWGRKNTERCIRDNGGEETVWDIVILDNGMRADVVHTNQIEFPRPSSGGTEAEPRRSSFISPDKDDWSFDAVQHRSCMIDGFDSPRLSLSPEDQHQVSEEGVRLYIMKQLPRGCHASIRTDLVTARTITVDVFDDNNAEISPPPGTTIVEERFCDDQDIYDPAPTDPVQRLPKHTVVFRTALNQSQSADVRPEMGEVHAESLEQPLIDTSTRQYVGSSQSQLDVRGNSAAAGKTTNILAPKERHKISNNSSQSNPDTASKDTFGSSLTRLAQKMRPVTIDNSGDTKQQFLKTPFEKTARSSESLLGKAPKSSSNQGKSSLNKEASSAANRSAPRSHLHDSPGKKSTSSPGSKQVKRGRSTKNDKYSIREKNQESFMAQRDAYSTRSVDRRPGSAAGMRNHARSSSSLSLARSEADMTVSVNNDGRPSSSSLHHRSKTFTPSIYSLVTAGSETSLILAHRTRRSAYDDTETVQALSRDGMVPGIFPESHFVSNIRRFSRFSSASYGSSALKVMGVRKNTQMLPPPSGSDSREHSDFSDHAGLPPSTILLSSFVDPEGGSNAAGETDTGFPLVHFLCVDHESKAIVLTLRGTWGFEDILTDMTCDYDDLLWQGRSWKVHKGMHASARRLLEGGGGRVMNTIRAALEEFPDYGVVMCGHSLGGGVAALLATMISEPVNETAETAFVTASYQSVMRRMLPSGNGAYNVQPYYFLPPGRPIHVYAYGPPAVMSPFLRRATRGLITTIVNGQDVVPSLSLGILHDMHAVSLAFKSDTSGTKSNVRYRVWESLRQSIVNKFYVNEAPMLLHAGDGVGEDAWAWQTLKGLREEMCALKLMPPGEVFVVETMRVLQRDAFTPNLGDDGSPRLGRPATRVQLKFIRDVENLFGELRFGSGMLSDHNPTRYEASLAALARGILDE